MKVKFKYIALWVAALIIVFTNKVQATTGKVSTDTLNLRSEASMSSSVVELLNEDDEIEIISDEGDWYKVKHGKNEGYVSKKYVKVDGDTTQENTTTSNTEPTTSQDFKAEANSTIKLDKDVTIKILPLINSKNLGTAKSGEEITVITTANNWIFIQTDEIAGWIVKDTSIGQTIKNEETSQDEDDTNTENDGEVANNDNTNEDNSQVDDSKDNDENDSETENSSSSTDYSKSVTKYVNVSSVYIRSKASTSSEIVTSLIKNTDVKVTGEEGDWYKVEFNNFKGYIYKDLLSDSKIEETNRGSSNREQAVKSTSAVTQVAETSASKGLEIVEYAKQYLNCPYVYGAAGSSSFDCSGFTMYVYKHFGYSLSHSATAQSKNGVYVSKENLQPGDLVFFLDYETMDGIGHCGIYIGDGNFIHASSGSGKCVKISTLLSGSYYNRYATARRLI